MQMSLESCPRATPFCPFWANADRRDAMTGMVSATSSRPYSCLPLTPGRSEEAQATPPRASLYPAQHVGSTESINNVQRTVAIMSISTKIPIRWLPTVVRTGKSPTKNVAYV